MTYCHGSWRITREKAVPHGHSFCLLPLRLEQYAPVYTKGFCRQRTGTLYAGPDTVPQLPEPVLSVSVSVVEVHIRDRFDRFDVFQRCGVSILRDQPYSWSLTERYLGTKQDLVFSAPLRAAGACWTAMLFQPHHLTLVDAWYLER